MLLFIDKRVDCENCNNVYFSRNCIIAADMEDSRYCAFITPGGSKDNWDFTHYGVKAELTYDSLQVGNQTSRVLFSWFIITGARDVEYSMFAVGCNNIFGSVGLKKRKYCILNKQYTKEEYEKQVVRIKEQMNKIPYIDTKRRVYTYGEFFPLEFSPFGYNETVLEFFSLSKDEAITKSYNWYEPKKREWAKSTYEIPDDIKDVKDDILFAVLTCIACDKNYRLIKPELQFYRKLEIPIPQKCYDCRHLERVKWRSPMRLQLRVCGKCGEQVKTNITQEINPTIYCEKCYLAEVV